MNDFAYSEKKCARCGKEFIVHSDWGYKRQGNLFCSYSCMRAYDKDRGTRADRRERIIQAIYDGLNTNEIVNLLNADRTTVIYWERKLKRENKEDKTTEG